jgi:hypothetical protein
MSAEANLTAAQVASRVHLIHVTGNPAGRIQFSELLLSQALAGEIPLSRSVVGGRSYCGPSSAFVERECGWSPRGVVYTYAGRALSNYGRVAFAFYPSVEDGRFFGATPFDSGRMLRATGFQSDVFRLTHIAPGDIPARTKLVNDLRLDSRWRDRFGDWLVEHFPGGPDGYWSMQPAPPGPGGLYDPANFPPDADAAYWTAWTWEVTLLAPVPLAECSAWCPDPDEAQVFRRIMMDGALTPAVDRLIMALNRKRIDSDLQGLVDYAAVLESWVRRESLK